MTQERGIETQACVDEGVVALVQSCPRMAHAVECIDHVPLRRREGGFTQLLGAIVSQQISVAAADGIWKKLEAAGFTNPVNILAASEDELRGAGLSRQKVKYARALAEADIEYDLLPEMPSDEVVKTLTRVSGIGTWTAEIYAMFSLGRADVFPAGDLALQESARLLYRLEARPKEKEMRLMAQAWAPWRAVAARILWAYYAYDKQREGIR